MLEGNRYYIVYNTLTKATILLDNSFYETLSKEGIIRLENNASENRRILRHMKHLKMLVDSSLTEREEINAAIQKIERSKMESDNFTIWLYLTYDCNFDCPYCMEQGNYKVDLSKSYMTSSTVEKIVDWTKLKMWENGCKRLSVVFFGGEPLLNLDMLLYACQYIRSVFAGSNVLFQYSIVSNGYLLSKEIVDSLIKNDVNIYQITLDGPAEIHDKRRKCKDGSSSFSTILYNIKYMVNTYPQKANCHVRMNLDKQNMDWIKQLLLLLKNEDLHCW